MFGRKKKNPIDQFPFVKGYRDAMDLACVELVGTRYLSAWRNSNIEVQAAFVLDKLGENAGTFTVSYEKWLDSEYIDGLVAYAEALEEAIRCEKDRRKVYRERFSVRF